MIKLDLKIHYYPVKIQNEKRWILKIISFEKKKSVLGTKLVFAANL